MDTKRMILGMLLIMLVGVGYQYFLTYEYARHPEWIRQDQKQNAGPTTQSSVQATTIAAAAAQPATTRTGWRVMAAGATEPVTIGSEKYNDAGYHMALAINATGAAVDSVVLNEFHKEVDSTELYAFQNPYSAPWNLAHSTAAVAVIVDGVTLDLWNQNFSLLSHTDETADYAALVCVGNSPVIRVVKEYAVDKAQKDPSTSMGYEAKVEYRLENLTSESHTATLEFSGPTMPQAESVRQDTEIVAGYDNQGIVKVEHQTVSSFTKTSPAKEFSTSGEADHLPLLWIGASSNYFNAVVHFEDSRSIASAQASVFDPEEQAGRVAIEFTTTPMDLAPSGSAGSSASVPMLVFFGPKMRGVLDARYYTSFPLEYDQTLVLTSGMCAFCTFPWLINFLVMLLAGLHWVLGDWGLAIIALVCGVRLALHPITKKSQVSMMKMQKLAPEMERLKKKFGDDKEGFNKAQVDLYKNVGFTPVLGCLPMFLQMPIFIALWRALQTTFELRQSPFLFFHGIHFTWIHDLSQPDMLWKFGEPVHLLFFTFAGINVLPLAMAVVTFVNTKYFTPRPAALTPEQEQQQKMMVWMTLVFPFMFYTFPSGLNLYYLTSTSLGILESKRIRDHIKQAEALEAERGPVIVDAGKLSRQPKRVEAAAVPARKSFWARMQDRIEEATRQAQQQQQKQKKKQK